MFMSDRSIRRTTAAETTSGVIGTMNTKCGESASKLRAAVDIAIGQLVAALDRAVYERSMSSSGSSIPASQQYVMKPYKSFKSLVANGSHLEHLHVYSPPASGQSKMLSSDAKTMDFHTDSGFLVAMTRGYYSSSTESVYSDRDVGRGLYLELSTGQRVKVDARDDALVVMVGAAASTWLEPLLGKPLRPAPHALVAGLSDAHPSVTRSWFGKMYLPPKDAVLPNPERASKQGRVRQLTYGQYREWELSGSTSQSSLPAACEIRTSSIAAATSSSPYSLLSASNTQCTIKSSNGTGVLCWMQCQAVDSLPCGTNAVCVDTNTGKEVDGSAHCHMSKCTLQCPVSPSIAPTLSPSILQTTLSSPDPSIAPSTLPTTNSLVSSSSSSSSSSNSSGLSGGQIAAIVICSTLAAAAVIALLYWWIFHKSPSKEKEYGAVRAVEVANLSEDGELAKRSDNLSSDPVALATDISGGDQTIVLSGNEVVTKASSASVVEAAV